MSLIDPRDIWIIPRDDAAVGDGSIDDPFDGGTRLGTAINGTFTWDLNCFILEATNSSFAGTPIGVEIFDALGAGAAWFNETFNNTLCGFTPVVLQDTGPTDPYRLHLLVKFRSTPGTTPPAPPTVPYGQFGDPLLQFKYTNSSGTTERKGGRIYWPVGKVTTSSAPGVSPLALGNYGAVEIAGLADTVLNGRHVALGQSATGRSFYIRLGAIPVSSNDCTARTVTHRFDEVMRSDSAAPNYSIIHLGPGTYETRGWCSAYISNMGNFTQTHVGWVVKPGQRLLGAGIGATTVKLVLPMDDLNQTTAIFTPYSCDAAEVADLTVDANAPGHAAPYGIFPAPYTCGGVGLYGSYLRLRRVRSINICTQNQGECFGLYLGPGSNDAHEVIPPTFNVMEDCVFDRVGENNTHETSLGSVVGDAYGNGRALICRHNYADCGYAGGVSSEPLRIKSITYASTEAIVETWRPHHRTAQQNVVFTYVAKRISNGSGGYDYSPSAFNHSFPITGVVDDFKFKVLKPAGAPANSADLVLTGAGNPVDAFIGVDFHAVGAGSGTGCVTEGNTVYDCLNAYYADTGSTRDTVVRDNYYSNVGYGVNMNFPVLGGGDNPRIPSAITPEAVDISGTIHKRGVFTTLQPHGLTPGNLVTIREAGEAVIQTNNAYHGAGLEVVEVRGDSPSRQFVYKLANQGAALPAYNCPGRPVFTPGTPTVPISTSAGSLGYTYDAGGSYVYVLTASAHGLGTGELMLIAGAGDTRFNGLAGPVDALSDTELLFNKELGSQDFTSLGGVVSRVSTPVSTLSYTAANTRLTTTTAVAHGLAIGDFVVIGGASDERFNGMFGPVFTVPSDTQFTVIRDLGSSGFSGSGGRLDRHIAAGVVRNGSVATVTTVLSPNFFVGQIFRMQGAYVNGNIVNRFNNVTTVKSVGDKLFSFALKPGNDPDTSASPNGPVLYAALWDVRRFVIENNLYDLYATDGNTAIPPQGVAMFGLPVQDVPPYRFPVLIVRENLVRSVSGPPPSSANKSYGVDVTTVGGGSVESNWLDVNQTPLYYRLSGSVNHLQNRNGANALLHPSDTLDAASPHHLDDLETRIQAALAMSLL